MNHLHPLKMKKELVMKLGKKIMMRFTKLEKLKSNSKTTKNIEAIQKPKTKEINRKGITKTIKYVILLKFYHSMKYKYKKMQRPISNKIQLGNTLNPARDYGHVPSIDDEGDLENLIGNVDKVGGFWKTGKADENLARYLLNILPVTRQNQVAGQLRRKAYASVMYSDKKILEFTLENTANIYTNYSSMEIVLPIQFTKKSNKIAQIDDDTVTANNFFRHWFTDIDIRRYPDDMKILPTNNSLDIYQY